MNKLLTIARIGYIIFGLLALLLLSIPLLEMFNALSANSESAADVFSQYIPVINYIILTIIYSSLIFLLSYFMLKRKRRKVCLIIAGISCMAIPIGTILGIITIYSLTRETIKAQFSS